MDVGTLYDSAPRKERYSYPSGTVYGNLYVMLLVIDMPPLENSLSISFLFSVKLAISPFYEPAGNHRLFLIQNCSLHDKST